MKKAVSAVLALGLVVSSMSMTTFAEGETNLRACIASEPETLDPNAESSVDGAVYAMHLFEGLMKYSNTENLAAE
jgi:oligopeptide transport system substrate-binding protein